MRLVVERERERMAVKIEEYWSIEGVCEKLGMDFPAKLVEVDGKKVAAGGSEGAGEKLEIKAEKEARAIADAVSNKPLTVIDVVKKEVSKAPPQPFTTSSLQIDANNKLGMSAKQTMTLAQQLYETGRITYMRTDSVNLADKFLDEAQVFLASEFGKDYATGSKKYKTNKKGAQEAHEAIRPIDPATTPESIRADLEPRLWKLYDLIWRRTLASQMPNARVNQVRVDMDVEKHVFRANGSSILFDGYTKIYQATKEKFLPDVKQGDTVNSKSIEPIQHFTEPPARYSDATLVKVLEEYGIGRPSTYAPIISTIIERGYVERDDNKKFKPTEVALLVNDLLVKNFPEVVDYEFTARVEDSLDDIAEGKKEWQPIIKEFYEPFKANLTEKYKEVKKEDVLHEKTDEKCELCGSPMVVRMSRYGKFLACSAFPKCKFTKPLAGENKKEERVQESDEFCAKCGSKMLIKEGKYGKFLGCSNYPKCKNM